MTLNGFSGAIYHKDYGFVILRIPKNSEIDIDLPEGWNKQSVGWGDLAIKFKRGPLTVSEARSCLPETLVNHVITQ